MLNKKNFLVYSNAIILLYVSLLSFFLLWFKAEKEMYFLLWFILDDIALFIHVPIIVFAVQCYLKYRIIFFEECSWLKLFFNSVAMSVISYILFYVILFSFFYKGEF